MFFETHCRYFAASMHAMITYVKERLTFYSRRRNKDDAHYYAAHCFFQIINYYILCDCVSTTAY